MKSADRNEELISKFLDGEITESEFEELKKQYENDIEFALKLKEQFQIDASLKEAFKDNSPNIPSLKTSN